MFSSLETRILERVKKTLKFNEMFKNDLIRVLLSGMTFCYTCVSS